MNGSVAQGGRETRLVYETRMPAGVEGCVQVPLGLQKGRMLWEVTVLPVNMALFSAS